MLRLVPLQGRNLLLCFLLGWLACTLAVLPLRAQSTTGSLAGTVFDPVHAVLPDAHIFLKNGATGAVLQAVSNHAGNYRFEGLAPGHYRLGVEAPGFAFFESSDIVVELGRQTLLDALLHIESAKTTVQVTTAVIPFMKLVTPGFSTNFTSSEMLDLPSSSRRWSSFAMLSPGVVSDQNGLGLLSFRGISVLLNNSTVDGADNNQAFFSEERGGVRAPYSISMGAVEQFQINTSNYSAEYGRAAGGVINTVTKSGANALHGEAFVFYRNAVLAATNPFTMLTTAVPSGDFVTGPYKPANERRQMGLALGGPLKKDRLFWFYSIDYEQKNFPAIARTGNPTAVFAQPLAAIPKGNYLGFPITCANLPPYNGSSGNSGAPATSVFYTSVFQFEATQGACEVYDRLDMPSYQAGVKQYQQGLQMVLSLSGEVPRTGSQTLNFPKLDWQINDRNHASFAYNRMRWDAHNGVQTQTSTQYGIDSFGNDTTGVDWLVARLASFLTENVANEVRFQYGRELDTQTSPAATGAEVPLANNQYGYAPEIRIAGGATGEGMVLGNPAKLPRPEYPNEHKLETADALSWVRGNNVLKFGADWDRNRDLLDNIYGGVGVYDYTAFGNFLADYYHAVDGLGPPAPVYYVDTYSGFSQSFGTTSFYLVTHDIAGFVNDEWHVHPRFTLTLGMRYEYERVPRAFLSNPQLPQTNNTPDDRNNLGPRAGFAWDIFGNGHTVVRAGAGVFYGRIVNGTLFSVLTGSGAPQSQRTYRYSTSIEFGAPQFPNIDFSVPTGAAVGSLPSAHFFQPNYQAPEILQGDLVLEQQVGQNTSVSFSLLASLGRELPNFVDTNVDNATIGQLTYTIDVPGPSLGKASPLPQGAKYTTPLYTSIRPNYLYSNITEMLSNVNSSYTAGVFQVQHRTWRGLTYGLNYTFAHALDYDQNEYLYKSPTNILEPNNMRLNYGNSNTDVRQRLVLHGTWWTLWHERGLLGKLVDNYSVSPIVTWQTGLPYTLGVGGSAPGGAFFGINGSGGPSRLNIFERNSYRFPVTQMTSLRLAKRVDFRRQTSLELMAEAYNLSNHTNVTQADTLGYTACSTPLTQGCPAQATTATPYLEFNPTYGTPTNANSNAIYSQRQIQLAVRLRF
jgi:hypothetical protein